jgi:hypothetical protein
MAATTPRPKTTVPAAGSPPVKAIVTTPGIMHTATTPARARVNARLAKMTGNRYRPP